MCRTTSGDFASWFLYDVSGPGLHKKVAHKTTWDDAVCIDVPARRWRGGEEERGRGREERGERGAEEGGRCWADFSALLCS